jgi:hypothetical protein
VATSGAQAEFNYEEALAALLKQQQAEIKEWEAERDRVLQRHQEEFKSIVPMFKTLKISPSIDDTDVPDDELIPSPKGKVSHHVRVTSEDVVISDFEDDEIQTQMPSVPKPPGMY